MRSRGTSGTVQVWYTNISHNLQLVYLTDFLVATDQKWPSWLLMIYYTWKQVCQLPTGTHAYWFKLWVINQKAWHFCHQSYFLWFLLLCENTVSRSEYSQGRRGLSFLSSVHPMNQWMHNSTENGGPCLRLRYLHQKQGKQSAQYRSFHTETRGLYTRAGCLPEHWNTHITSMHGWHAYTRRYRCLQMHTQRVSHYCTNTVA